MCFLLIMIIGFRVEIQFAFMFFVENVAKTRQPALCSCRKERREQEESLSEQQLELQPVPQHHHEEEGRTKQSVRIFKKLATRWSQTQVSSVRVFCAKLRLLRHRHHGRTQTRHLQSGETRGKRIRIEK